MELDQEKLTRNESERSRELAQRIETGDGFDDIARLAGWDGIYLTSLHCPEDHPFLGRSLAQIAALTGQDPLNCCCDLLVREDCQITMIDFMASEEDITAILQSPLSHLISDATYPTEHVTRGLVEETLKKFIGEILQVPPAFSACMVNGKRAYDLARKGEEVELKPKLLVIDEIELLDDGLDIAEPWIKVRVVCSKGTYIRALARDIGEALQSGAHLTALERTRVGDVRLADCLNPLDFKEWIEAQEIDI